MQLKRNQVDVSNQQEFTLIRDQIGSIFKSRFLHILDPDLVKKQSPVNYVYM